MFGSDWPVAEVVGGYDPVLDALRAVLASYGPELVAQLFGGTAVNVYRLDVAGAPRVMSPADSGASS